ncbi:hypothetical protein D778_00929 [Xanthomarina gelatinilytica]|uniref:Uncharacterized protein n=1 Tax=Xanthomarina gelatinilytica TaxID=1137281 RepID=M7MXK8_9FLAO|nr:hypothetical protein D778_00929 [Xanthomarina gelatinilytica]
MVFVYVLDSFKNKSTTKDNKTNKRNTFIFLFLKDANILDFIRLIMIF